MKKRIKFILLLVALSFFLIFNYMYNFLDENNTGFTGFQKDSEALVISKIIAEEKGIESSKYGLGQYSDIIGGETNWENAINTYYKNFNFLNNENYINGISEIQPQIAIRINPYNEKIFVIGNNIIFNDEYIFPIIEITSDEEYIYLSIEAKNISLNSIGFKLYKIEVTNQDGEKYDLGYFQEYKSQLGLQGIIFSFISKIIGYNNSVSIFHLACSLLMGLVSVLIVFGIYKKYNSILAGCFYIVFLLSPWIVNFAKNLFWVEFTWFVPMLIGLTSSIYINNRKIRNICLIGVFASILIRSLCGYEFITTIMLSAISFLLIDFILLIINKKREQAIFLFKYIIKFAFCALAGFIFAIIIHSIIRGEGNITEGFVSIIKEDVMRRTWGGNLLDFDKMYFDSFNSSVLEVLNKYFNFSTQVITGIDANIFPLITIAPIFIFIFNFVKRKIIWEDLLLYFISLIATISWFVLAKSHSYIHTHMNFVLWYFGYVQVCLYIITKKIIEFITSLKK